jgi:hypothetical protein
MFFKGCAGSWEWVNAGSWPARQSVQEELLFGAWVRRGKGSCDIDRYSPFLVIIATHRRRGGTTDQISISGCIGDLAQRIMDDVTQ